MTHPNSRSECADRKQAANTKEVPENTAKNINSIQVEDLTRKLGFIESLLLYCERKNIFQSIGIAVKLNRPARELTTELAYFAIRRLILSYPLLFMFPEIDENREWRWKPIQRIAFKDVFQVNDDEIECFAAESANAKILNALSTKTLLKQKKPLWKIVYYSHTQWLAFHCTHSFTDGGSVIAYLKEIVETMNEVEDSPGIDCSSSADLTVVFNLENDISLLQHKISPDIFEKLGVKPDFATKIIIFVSLLAFKLWPGLVSFFVETYKQNQFFVDQLPVPISKEEFFESDYVICETSPLNNVNPIFINISYENVQFILKNCRSRAVKLQTYVVLVYIHTLHTFCPGLYFDKYLKIGSAVSLRNLSPELQSHQNYLGKEGRFDDGFYSFIAHFFISPFTAFSWKNVRKYNDFLHTEIHSERWLREYYIACQTLTPELYMDSRVNIKRDDLFLAITNLGEIEVCDNSRDSESKFGIENIMFSPCSGATLGTHHLTMCSTKQSGLNIGFTDGDPNVSNWRKFREDFKRNLIQLASKEG